MKVDSSTVAHQYDHCHRLAMMQVSAKFMTNLGGVYVQAAQLPVSGRDQDSVWYRSFHHGRSSLLFLPHWQCSLQ